MKPCDPRWREELVDHALGSPASAALTEHLAGCTVCTATLRDWKSRMGKIDAAVRELVASEPSAQAAARWRGAVRARRFVWSPGWAWRTAAFGVLAVVIMLFAHEWRIRERRKEADKVFSAASAIGQWRSPTESLLRFPNERWLKAPPQLGEYFYQLSTNPLELEKEGRTHDQ